MRQRLSIFAVFLFVFAGVSGPLRGQDSEAPKLDPDLAIHQYVYQQWDVDEGLPYSSIRSIVQTGDGYLWLGTAGGLVRFDGVKFTLFNTTNTAEFKTNPVSKLLASQDGSLWIAFGPSGLAHLKDGAFTAYSTENGLPDNFVSDLYEDETGSLWIATRNGLARLKGGKMKAVLPSEFGASWISAITGHRDGGLWLAIRGRGVIRFHQEMVSLPFVQTVIADQYVRSLEAGPDGGLWMGTNNSGIFRYDGDEVYQVEFRGLGNKFGATTLYEDRSGFLWIPSRRVGLLRLKDAEFSAFAVEHGLEDNRIHAVFEDREGNLWIGGQAGVLSRFKNGQAVTFTVREGLADDLVRSIFEAPDGGLLIGGVGGVDRLFEGRITNLASRRMLGGANTNAVLMNTEGVLYVGTSGAGLFQFTDGAWTQYRASDVLPNDRVRVLTEDKNGDLWIGTPTGFSHFRDGEFTNYELAHEFEDPRIFAIVEDHEGSIWVVGNSSLARMKDGVPEIIVEDVRLMSIYEDAEGVWWLGSRGQGLYRLFQGKLKNFTVRDGLFDDFAWTIFEDRRQNLWMCADKGIYSVNKKDLIAFAEGIKPKIDSTGYGTAQGMKSIECNGGNQPSGAQTRDGKIWFPTQGGVVRVDPEFPPNRQAPPVLIEILLYKGTSYSPDKALVFEPGKREIEIHYTGLSFVDPEKVQFRYQLVGFDDDWVEVGTRRWAHYGNLPPGDYVFRVMASNNSGLWSESAAQVSFEMLPFFYETLWFYALLGLLAGLSLFGAYKWRTQRLRARQLKLEEQVREKTAELREARDVAQEAEREIRSSEEFLQTVLDTSPVPIYITSKKEGRFLMANKAAAQLNRLTQSELLQHTTKNWFLDPKERKRLVRQIEKTGRIDAVDLRARRLGTGEDCWLSFNARLIDYHGQEAILAVTEDITERKQSELENERLRTGLHSSGVGTYFYDIVTDTLDWDDNSLSIFGLSRDQLTGLDTWSNALHPDDRDETLKFLDGLHAKGSTEWNRQFRIVRPCGEVRFVHAEGFFERDEKGKEIYHYGTHRDITERKEAERTLEQANERLEFAEARQRAIFESMVDAVITIDQAGIVQSFSQSAEKIFGFTADEVIGQNVKTLMPGDIAAEHDGYLRRYADTGEPHIIGIGREVEALRQDGSVFPADLAVAELRFKGEQLYVGVISDITERKEAEENLKHQSALVDLLRQTASDANEAMDFKQGAGVCLKSINAYTGWPVGHVYLLSEDDENLLVPSHIWHIESKKRFKAIFDVTEKTTFKRGIGLPGRVLKSGEQEWIKDVTVDPNFPRAKMVDDIGVKGAFAFPVWAESKVVAVFEFFDEEASEPDESLLQTVTHIGSQLGRLYEREKAATSLREARDVAEEATRAKDMFLAAMSHEIRTPMNGVVGMIELLQGTALVDDQRRMLETAKDSSFTLLTIINDILDFSKIEAGKMKIENFAFDLRKAADTVGEMLGSVMAAEKRLPLIVHVQPEVPPILLGDQVRIRQVLLNLAGNAVKFTDDGEVRIGISVAKTHKDGSVDMVYEIKDSGIGMTKEQINRLFKPFEQAEASTTRRYGGTGLGLSIVARLVELMGGKIEMDSKPGKGSTFRIMLHHGIPKVKAKEAAGTELGRIKMLVLSKVGSRTDLLAQLLEANDNGRIDIVAPSTKKAALLKKLAAAEKDGDAYVLVYLSAEVGTGQQDQLRLAIENSKGLQKTPRFMVERHNTPIAQDMPGSVLIPPTPYTETNLVRALAIVLGKASPDIASLSEVEGRAVKVPSIEEAEAAGTLILVAEDNKTNQDVIGRQLAVFGYAHEIADDGEIALAMLSKRAYGLLLSDVHMPNMDGYQLTKAIRKKEEKSGARLPIVAVTANALQGEGDRCLDAGMDAYMAKPVRMKELRICLGRWLSEAEEKRATDSSGVDEAAAATSPADKSGSSVVEPDMLIEMFGDDEEMISSILADFPPAAWEGIDEIEKAYNAKDWSAVGDAGHKLKSAARTIGANQLADIFEGLEEAGQAGDVKTIKELKPKLRPAMEAVEAYLSDRV